MVYAQTTIGITVSAVKYHMSGWADAETVAACLLIFSFMVFSG